MCSDFDQELLVLFREGPVALVQELHDADDLSGRRPQGRGQDRPGLEARGQVRAGVEAGVLVGVGDVDGLARPRDRAGDAAADREPDRRDRSALEDLADELVGARLAQEDRAALGVRLRSGGAEDDPEDLRRVERRREGLVRLEDHHELDHLRARHGDFCEHPIEHLSFERRQSRRPACRRRESAPAGPWRSPGRGSRGARAAGRAAASRPSAALPRSRGGRASPCPGRRTGPVPVNISYRSTPIA